MLDPIIRDRPQNISVLRLALLFEAVLILNGCRVDSLWVTVCIEVAVRGISDVELDKRKRLACADDICLFFIVTSHVGHDKILSCAWVVIEHHRLLLLRA